MRVNFHNHIFRESLRNFARPPAQIFSTFEKCFPSSRDHPHQFLGIFIKFSWRTNFFTKNIFWKMDSGFTTLNSFHTNICCYFSRSEHFMCFLGFFMVKISRQTNTLLGVFKKVFHIWKWKILTSPFEKFFNFHIVFPVF